MVENSRRSLFSGVVMAVDAGTHSGVAVFEIKESRLVDWWVQEYQGRSVVGWCEMADEILQLFSNLDVDVLVVEDFILNFGGSGRGQSSEREGLSSPRVAAMLSYGLFVNDQLDCLVWQTPSERMVVSDERLKRWGFWVVGSDHCRDAVRHAIVWCRKHSVSYHDVPQGKARVL